MEKIVKTNIERLQKMQKAMKRSILGLKRKGKKWLDEVQT